MVNDNDEEMILKPKTRKKERILGKGIIPPLEKAEKRRKRTELLVERKRAAGIPKCLWTKKGDPEHIVFIIEDDELKLISV